MKRQHDKYTSWADRHPAWVRQPASVGSVSHPQRRNRGCAGGSKPYQPPMPGSPARLRASLSRATNKTTSMRAPGLSLLAAVVAISASSDALSTLNGRVDEEHNAIVVEGGSPSSACVGTSLFSGFRKCTSVVLKSVYAAEHVSATNKHKNPNMARSSSSGGTARISLAFGESIHGATLLPPIQLTEQNLDLNCFWMRKSQFSSVGLRRFSYRQDLGSSACCERGGGLTLTANNWNKVNKLSQLNISFLGNNQKSGIFFLANN